MMTTRQVELPDYVAALPPLESPPISIERHDRAGGLHAAAESDLVRPGVPRKHDRETAAAHAARAMLDDAKQDAAETIERAREEARTLLEHARAEAKAHREQARAVAEKLTQSECAKPASTLQQQPKTTPNDTWALPFDPPPLTPEDIAASRPVPRFFGRAGERRLQLHPRAA
jgi:hypothetical protein